MIEYSEQEKNNRAKKMMLWFGMVSLAMGFAGWTSAYIVSSAREDWDSSISLPIVFYISTGVILLSSLTYIMAKMAVKEDKQTRSTNFLLITLLLGLVFVVLQFSGFSQMVEAGYYFTGPTSTIKMSYVFLIAMVHIVHVVAGMISLLVVLYNQKKGKYGPSSYLGMTLGATFWHFLGLLWLYLVMFMTYVR